VIIAIDVYYSGNKAKSVGVLFESWDDAEPFKVISAYTDNPLEYEPGFFINGNSRVSWIYSNLWT